MTDAASVVVVGGGVAGLATVTALRAGGHVGPITLISREGLPYDRPMLSKDYLAGTRSAAQIELQPQEWFARNDIALLDGAEAAAVAAHETAVFLTDGRTIESEWIVLATGGRAARPGIPGLDSARVHLLRARPDADRLRAALTPGARLLVVGGGLLGSEAAATATALGARVTLIDPLDPPHVSALGTSMAAWLHAQHTAHGVRVVTASLDALADQPDGIRAEWSDGGSASFDAALVASGMTPETDLAERAGIEVGDGILVDGSLRSSRPRILAVGDCARVRGETRAEHWDAAQVAGNRAAATILGTFVAPSTAPWFWSDRYGRHVEVVGAMAGPEGRHAGVVRGDPGPGVGGVRRPGARGGIRGRPERRAGRAAPHRPRHRGGSGPPGRPGDRPAAARARLTEGIEELMTDAGHPTLEDYALLSGRQTAALVAHGSVDWLCLPRFDSPSVFTRLLGGPDHGYWRIRPRDGHEVGRSYRAGSFVLDTEWAAPSGTATTTDFLTMDHGARGDDAVSMVRRVTCTGGSLEVEADLVIRFDYGRVVPWVRRRADADGTTVLYAIAGPDSLTLRGPGMRAHERTHRGRYRLEAGQELTWTLTWLPSCDGLPPAPDADAELRLALDDWADWRAGVAVSSRYASEIGDSLAVLRALTSCRTGGIVAAPTTSLPETLGGGRNWDYRFTWLRDSAFTIEVLAAHGHHHFARQWRDWLLRAIAGDPEDLQIMYGLDGARQLPERVLDHLAGYRGSVPVRVGNAAFTQYQADVIGEVMLALSRLREAGIAEDRFSWGLQAHLLGLLESRLRTPDRGIWEVRGEPHLFTHGRVMMWAAFDQGVRAVERHGHPGPVERWRPLRDELRAEILARGARDGAFVQHYDTDAVDAALLQIPQTGFVAADSDLMLATVARIEAELLDPDGFVRRYVTDGSDGLVGSEGAFLMCTFWLVEQYAGSGRRDEATALMDRLLGIRSDLGLLAEEYDPARGCMLGNYPQAFSHLALIRAAEALGR